MSRYHIAADLTQSEDSTESAGKTVKYSVIFENHGTDRMRAKMLKEVDGKHEKFSSNSHDEASELLGALVNFEATKNSGKQASAEALGECFYCGKTVTQDDVASFYRGETEVPHPVCAECAETELKYDSVDKVYNDSSFDQWVIQRPDGLFLTQSDKWCEEYPDAGQFGHDEAQSKVNELRASGEPCDAARRYGYEDEKWLIGD